MKLFAKTFLALFAAHTAQVASQTTFSSWTQFDTSFLQARENSVNYAPLYPPGKMRFTESVGTFGFDENNADFDVIVNAAPPRLSFGVPVWYVKVAETNNVFVYTSEGVEFHTATVPSYDKLAWTHAVYGEPPVWVTGSKLVDWYEERARERMDYGFLLVPSADLAQHNANRIAASQSNTTPNDGLPVVPADTNRVAFAKVDIKNGVFSYVMYSPVNAPVDIFSKNELKPGLWDYRGFTYSSPEFGEGVVSASAQNLFFHAARGDIDSTGCGIPDGIKHFVFGGNIWLWDSGGDLLSDWIRFYLLGLTGNAIDSDGDGYTDAEQIMRGFDPTVPLPGASTSIRYYYDEDDRLTATFTGADGGAAAAIVSPAGNTPAQYERGSL